MADLSDVTAYLAQQAANAVYPNGATSPSVASMDCLIYEGWPLGDQLDLDINGQERNATGATVARPGGPRANVSIYPMPGTGVPVYQIQDHTKTIVEPAIGLTATLSGDTVTVSGTSKPGEYITIIADDAYIYSETGANAAAILAALATAAQANYPGASSTATTLTIPVGHSIVMRQGGVGTVGRVTHRQKHAVMITVWAPNRVVRNELAEAIDGLIKQTNRVSFPDTSQAVVVYNRTIVNDEQQAESIYRRDLIYDVEYATVFQFPATVVTSTQVSLVNASGTLASPTTSPIATALT
jgi:hypothetical protein